MCRVDIVDTFFCFLKPSSGSGCHKKHRPGRITQTPTKHVSVITNILLYPLINCLFLHPSNRIEPCSSVQPLPSSSLLLQWKVTLFVIYLSVQTHVSKVRVLCIIPLKVFCFNRAAAVCFSSLITANSLSVWTWSLR